MSVSATSPSAAGAPAPPYATLAPYFARLFEPRGIRRWFAGSSSARGRRRRARGPPPRRGRRGPAGTAATGRGPGTGRCASTSSSTMLVRRAARRHRGAPRPRLRHRRLRPRRPPRSTWSPRSTTSSSYVGAQHGGLERFPRIQLRAAAAPGRALPVRLHHARRPAALHLPELAGGAPPGASWPTAGAGSTRRPARSSVDLTLETPEHVARERHVMRLYTVAEIEAALRAARGSTCSR